MSERVLAFSAKDWLITGLLVMAEGALIWLAVNLLMRPAGSSIDGMPATTVAFLSLAATALPRLCHDRGIWTGAYSVTVTLGMAATTTLAIRTTAFPDYKLLDSVWLEEAYASALRHPSDAAVPVWMVIGTSVLIWWRGSTRVKPDIDTALNYFRIGSVLIALLVSAHTIVEHGISDQGLSAAVLTFFSSVLLAIAMLRQEMVPWRATTRWLETVALPVVLIVAPTALLIGLLTRDLNGMVQLLLDPVILLLTLVLRAVALILFVVAMIILLPIVWLISLLPISERPADEQPPLEFSRTTFESASDRATTTPELLRYVMAFLVVAGIIALVARFRLRLGYQDGEGDSERQSLRVEGSLLHNLRNWLDGLRGDGRRTEEDALAHLRGKDEWRYTLHIRERYRDFLRWSVLQEQPRWSTTTPDELSAGWATQTTRQREDAIATMTVLYDRARYGAAPMTESDARLVDEAWVRLSADPTSIARS